MSALKRVMRCKLLSIFKRPILYFHTNCVIRRSHQTLISVRCVFLQLMSCCNGEICHVTESPKRPGRFLSFEIVSGMRKVLLTVARISPLVLLKLNEYVRRVGLDHACKVSCHGTSCKMPKSEGYLYHNEELLSGGRLYHIGKERGSRNEWVKRMWSVGMRGSVSLVRRRSLLFAGECGSNLFQCHFTYKGFSIVDFTHLSESLRSSNASFVLTSLLLLTMLGTLQQYIEVFARY